MTDNDEASSAEHEQAYAESRIEVERGRDDQDVDYRSLSENKSHQLGFGIGIGREREDKATGGGTLSLDKPSRGLREEQTVKQSKSDDGIGGGTGRREPRDSVSQRA